VVRPIIFQLNRKIGEAGKSEVEMNSLGIEKISES